MSDGQPNTYQKKQQERITTLEAEAKLLRMDGVTMLRKLNAIASILDNPFHQVGYLVNAAPIRHVIENGIE